MTAVAAHMLCHPSHLPRQYHPTSLPPPSTDAYSSLQGHMAVKWGKAFGAEVTVISTSPNKKAEALERLGADKFVVRCGAKVKAATGSGFPQPLHPSHSPS